MFINVCIIIAKIRDTFDQEDPESTFLVTLPRNRAINTKKVGFRAP